MSNTKELSQRIDNAYQFVNSKTSASINVSPKIGIILGSGLGDFADSLESAVKVPFSEIPGFPLSTVEGHNGAFVFGSYKGISVVALQGRLRYYEGYTPQEVTMPIRVMRKTGVEKLIITNSAGGINLDFSAGTIMLIKDHINYTGANPLIGSNLSEFGPRFPDVSDIYTKELREKIKEAALKENIVDLREGVYIGYSGPNYETAAEIKFFRMIGADAVGMSTVHEALAATHCGMKVTGISCITNMATGVLDQKLSHNEVVEIAEKTKPKFTKLLDIAIKAASL